MKANSKDIRILDSEGNAVETTTSDPTGAESGVVVRNIPSGQQSVVVESDVEGLDAARIISSKLTEILDELQEIRCLLENLDA